MPAMKEQPSFRDLSPDEVTAVLARNTFGRLAYSFRDRVDVRPLSYVYADGWLYGRTEDSDKLTTLRHNQWVAFEVDEVRGPFDWVSVVVHGGFYLLSPVGAGRERWEEAVERLRRVSPHALTADDPTPHRMVLFRIAVQELSGRSASARASPAPPPADVRTVGEAPTPRAARDAGAPGAATERRGEP